MGTSKKLFQPVTVIKHGKTCNEKNRITDKHIKRHDSRKKSEINDQAFAGTLNKLKRHHQTQKGTTVFQICENSNNVR